MKRGGTRGKDAITQPRNGRNTAAAMLSLTLFALGGCASMNMANRSLRASSSTSALPPQAQLVANIPLAQDTAGNPVQNLELYQQKVNQYYHESLQNCKSLQSIYL